MCAKKSETSAAPSARGTDPIDAALLDQRPNKRVIAAGVRELRRSLDADRIHRRALLRDYADGLAAERAAAAELRSAGRNVTRRYRQAVRATLLSRVGRRIDLMSLLALSTSDGRPAWTIADPTCQSRGVYIYYMAAGQPANGRTWGNDMVPGAINGQSIMVGHDAVLFTPHCRGVRSPGNSGTTIVPTGMPPIPPAVRTLATDPTVRRRAKWVGVLYQPTAWEELRPNPDPALVVEWTDRPGEYYALCVWGGDRARIMEFVD